MDLISQIENHTWPTIPNRVGSTTLAVLYQLEKSQWWKPEQILAHQFKQLNHMWEHAISSVPFYKKHLLDAGFRENQKITSDQWPDVPILTRKVIQRNGDELLSTKLPKSQRISPATT